MFDWIADIFNKVVEAVIASGQALTELVTRLNGITFSGNSTINLLIGSFRYLVGDPIFMMFYSLMMIGAGYIVYKLIKSLIAVITSVLPQLNKVKLG